jgi:hypothetical protein
MLFEYEQDHKALLRMPDYIEADGKQWYNQKKYSAA